MDGLDASSTQFLLNLVKGDSQWRNVPYVVRMALKSIHDILVTQTDEITNLRAQLAALSISKPSPSRPRRPRFLRHRPDTSPSGGDSDRDLDLDPDLDFDFDVSSDMPYFTYLLRQCQEFKSTQTDSRRQKTSLLRIESELQKRALSSDVLNVLKTKLDTELYTRSREVLERDLRTSLDDVEKKVAESARNLASLKEESRRFNLSRIEEDLGGYGRRLGVVEEEVTRFSDSLRDVGDRLGRKVEVGEVRMVVDRSLKEELTGVMRKLQEVIRNESESITERMRAYSFSKLEVEDRVRALVDKIEGIEGGLGGRFDAKVDIVTVNAWIEKHTREVSEILRRIRGVEMTEIRDALKKKVGVTQVRGVLVEQEKLKAQVAAIVDASEKENLQSARILENVSGKLDRFGRSVEDIERKLSTKIERSEMERMHDMPLRVQSEIDQLQERFRAAEEVQGVSSRKLKATVEKIRQGVLKLRSDVDGKRYMTAERAREWFDDRIKNLKRSIETLHQAIGQLLILNQSGRGQAVNEESGVDGGRSVSTAYQPVLSGFEEDRRSSSGSRSRSRGSPSRLDLDMDMDLGMDEQSTRRRRSDDDSLLLDASPDPLDSGVGVGGSDFSDDILKEDDSEEDMS